MLGLAKRQKNRADIQSIDSEEYFMVALFTLLFDSFVRRLNFRLVNHKNIITGFQCRFKVQFLTKKKL